MKRFLVLLISVIALSQNTAFGEASVFQKPTDWQIDLTDRFGYSGIPPSSDPNVPNGTLKNCDFAGLCDGNDKVPFHTGVDYEKQSGSWDVRATSYGQVSLIQEAGPGDHAMGNVVILVHWCKNKGDCPPYGTVYSLYAHMESIDSAVWSAKSARGTKQGWIAPGQRIGKIGGMGYGKNNTWPPHLHHEMKKEPTVGAPWCNRIDWHFTKMPDWVPYYGYTPVHPVECGYVDPNDYIGKVEVFNPYATDIDEPPVPPSMVIGVSPGPSSSKPITDPTSSGKPDFTVEHLRLLGTDGVEKYRFKKTDILCMEAKLKNIGSKGIGDDDIVRTRFLLSKGYREDPHGEWRGIESFDTRGGHVEPGESHTEMHCVSLADKDYVLPGHVYNIVAYADRTEVNNNDGGKYAEEHESNNSTTEAVFEVEGSYDFALVHLVLADTQMSAGKMLGATIGVRNLGDQPNEAVDVGIFVSPNQDWNGRWLAERYQITPEELPQGGVAFRNINVISPSAPGQYTFWVCANPEGTIPETDGSNNCAPYWFEVVSNLNLSLSDLVLSKQAFAPGERMPLSATSLATGAPLTQSVDLSFFLTQSSWENRRAIDVTTVPPLQEGVPHVETGYVLVAPQEQGAYTLYACINASGMVAETYGGDNCQSTWFKVENPNPPPAQPDDEDEEAAILLLQMMMRQN